jgi:hypothetical protein
MLILKAWMETRWRLLILGGYVLASLALARYGNTGPAALTALGLALALFAMPLAGAGVKSQAPAVFVAGLAGSEQFTLSLPVTRFRLLAVRVVVGLAELAAATALTAALAWLLLPGLRAAVPAVDLTRLALAAFAFFLLPFCAHVLFAAWLDEPLSLSCAAFTTVLCVWLGHSFAPQFDILGAFGSASPLVTHRLPWPQLAIASAASALLLLGAVRVVQKREY